MEEAVGILLAIFASICFGVQYTPVKNRDIGDGSYFQYFMCQGILFLSLAVRLVALAIGGGDTSPLSADSLSASDTAISIWGAGSIALPVEGIVGGILWGVANYLVILNICHLGLGSGFALYHGINLVAAYLFGRFGWLGVPLETGRYPALQDVGFALLLVSFVLNALVPGEGASPTDVEGSGNITRHGIGGDGITEHRGTDEIGRQRGLCFDALACGRSGEGSPSAPQSEFGPHRRLGEAVACLLDLFQHCPSKTRLKHRKGRTTTDNVYGSGTWSLDHVDSEGFHRPIPVEFKSKVKLSEGRKAAYPSELQAVPMGSSLESQCRDNDGRTRAEVEVHSSATIGAALWLNNECDMGGGERSLLPVQASETDRKSCLLVRDGKERPASGRTVLSPSFHLGHLVAGSFPLPDKLQEGHRYGSSRPFCTAADCQVENPKSGSLLSSVIVTSLGTCESNTQWKGEDAVGGHCVHPPQLNELGSEYQMTHHQLEGSNRFDEGGFNDITKTAPNPVETECREATERQHRLPPGQTCSGDAVAAATELDCRQDGGTGELQRSAGDLNLCWGLGRDGQASLVSPSFRNQDLFEFGVFSTSSTPTIESHLQASGSGGDQRVQEESESSRHFGRLRRLYGGSRTIFAIPSPSDMAWFLLWRVTGVLAGLFTALSSCCFASWRARNAATGSMSPLTYMLAQSLGIVSSAAVLLLIAFGVAKLRGVVVRKSVFRPPFLIGALWASGAIGLLYAIDCLGYTVGYVLCAVLPILVATAFAFLIYGELRRGSSRLLFWTAILFQLIGIVAISIGGLRS